MTPTDTVLIVAPGRDGSGRAVVDVTLLRGVICVRRWSWVGTGPRVRSADAWRVYARRRIERDIPWPFGSDSRTTSREAGGCEVATGGTP